MAVKTHLVMSSDGEPYRIIHLRGGIRASSVDRVGNNHSTLKRVNMKQKGTRSGARQRQRSLARLDMNDMETCGLDERQRGLTLPVTQETNKAGHLRVPCIEKVVHISAPYDDEHEWSVEAEYLRDSPTTISSTSLHA